VARAGWPVERVSAPVFARGLRHQGQALQAHRGRGAVERGAVARRPARAAHLVGQAQVGVALGGQRHRHGAHAGARAGQAVALGAHGLEREFRRLQAALRLVLALQVVLRAAAQGFGSAGDERRRRGRLAVGRAGGGGLQVALRQFQRLHLGAGAGHFVLGLAPAFVERAGAAARAAGDVAVLHLHAALADAHGRLGADLQAGRVQSLWQALEGVAAAARRDARHALHGGAAGVDLDAGDARRRIRPGVRGDAQQIRADECAGWDSEGGREGVFHGGCSGGGGGRRRGARPAGLRRVAANGQDMAWAAGVHGHVTNPS
jgi:hypothetical protein